MPKGKQEQELELNFGTGDEREFEGSDANPIDAATGESLFDELSPRFVRQVEKAAEKEQAAKKRGKPANEDEDLDPTDDEDPDESDEDEEEDTPDPSDEDEEEAETDGQDDAAEGEEDADEPRRGKGNTAFEKRLARADRLLEETRIQLAEVTARQSEREQKDALDASVAAFDTFKTTTETKLKKLKADKVNAVENGDTAAQIELDDQMVQLRAELVAKTSEHERAKTELEAATKRKRASPITLTKVAQWKRKNPRYETDPEFAAHVNRIDRELASAGSNPESDDHYKAIDRQIGQLFPARRKAPVRKHPSAQVTREGAPTQRRQSGDAKVSIKGNKIKITPAKLARVKDNMARFGMDPNDKAALKDYILNNPGI